MMKNSQDGPMRVVIERVSPELDGGRFPIKRVLGEEIQVEADVFADGHDVLAARVCYRHRAESDWTEVRMKPWVNDRWRGTFSVDRLGLYDYTITAWVDHFGTWRRDLEKKFKAGQDIGIELMMGVAFFEVARATASGHDADDLRNAVQTLSAIDLLPTSAKVGVALSPRMVELMERHGARTAVVRYERELQARVDPVLARFGAWFEMFPRSAAREGGRHGTLRDCAEWLPQIASMGFDVLYLPPIHPIGTSFRKGKNNSLSCTSEDPGSPWAVGGLDGGHKSVHKQLGTLEDFQQLVQRARELGIQVALDIAFQCSPDHPYAKDHPEWFRKRPDGTIQYAENPPKKYQDIYPLDFESTAWETLWHELKSIFEFWIVQGVRIFRVDNPHTKSFRFWEWCLTELKEAHPELIFLSEAFTRPKIMAHLAKIGYTQSYNYFPWRNTKHELTEYLTELTQGPWREYFRPNLWPNTPDILPQYLQFGGPPAFMARLILAATLGASYGLYALPFAVCENTPREPGSEEYLNSEKYEIRHWKLDTPGNLIGLMAKVNQIRRDHPALQRNDGLQFHRVDNEQLIAYSKATPSLDDLVLIVVNLDPHHTQRGWVNLPIEQWGIQAHETFQCHELLTGAYYLWTGSSNYIELDPRFVPAHVLHIRRYVRTELDFDYFM